VPALVYDVLSGVGRSLAMDNAPSKGDYRFQKLILNWNKPVGLMREMYKNVKQNTAESLLCLSCALVVNDRYFSQRMQSCVRVLSE